MSLSVNSTHAPLPPEALRAVADKPLASPSERAAEAPSQGMVSPDAMAQTPASPALTAMALTALHSQAPHWREQVGQEPHEEQRRHGHNGREHEPVPFGRDADGEEENEAQRPDPARPLPKAADLHGRVRDALRQGPTSPALAEALQAMLRGRPLLLAAPREVPRSHRCDADAWLLRPGTDPSPRWSGQLVFGRIPTGSEQWCWRAHRDRHPADGSVQWLAREARSAGALWLGATTTGQAFSDWREVLLVLPAAHRLQQALDACFSVQLLTLAAPLRRVHEGSKP